MKLRPITMEDADQMLEWKNYPETRQFAIASHDEITKEAHYAWLKDHLDGFFIIENDDGVRCGAVRIHNNEVSFWVDRSMWGKGIATWVLIHVTYPGLFGKIVDGNLASMRCFIRAGYEPVSYHDGYSIWQKK